MVEQFRKDILTLRKKQEPQPPLMEQMTRPQGGKLESEQTARMRAAIEFIQSKSSHPYQCLADLWNAERGGEYYADNIRSRLRKGPEDEIDKGAGMLEYWWEIYYGDFTAVFPAPFPLHSSLATAVDHR